MKTDIKKVVEQIKKARDMLNTLEYKIETQSEIGAESTKAHITQAITHLKEAKKAIGDHN